MTIFRAARILGKPSAISSSSATAGATLCAARSALLPQLPCSARPRLPQAAPRQKPRATASTSRSSTAGIDANHHVAPGYRGQVLLRWGDPLFPDSPAFNPTAQSAAAQLKQFGYNNDYVAFFPLDDSGKRGLLCVNHEYTNEEVMFPGISKRQDTSGFEDMTAELVDIEMAAHGVSIVEIAREGEDWRVVLDSQYNRRISPGNTEMKVDGPAAGDARLKTSADPTGQDHPRHAQQLRRRQDAVGHLPHGGRELPRLFLVEPMRAWRRPPQGPRRRPDQELRPLRHSRASGRPGANSTTASMSTRSRTSRTASAGSWRSIQATRPPFQ